ncbi:MAG TPA: SDR family oxidoreductase [Allosphingosinicella sp.]|jgi:NAD(P)-dependent dehydrogenase (short-subunit alcohol dehydrogenase family)
MPRLLLTGAGRGIGLEFARQYADDGWSVIATVRNEAAAEKLRALPGDIQVQFLDMRDHGALVSFAKSIEGPLDLFIANAGMTRPDGITADDADGWIEVLDVNCVAPTFLAYNLAQVVAEARGKMIAITSQMGSIADNSSGGWNAYRASKAALNAAWRSMAVEMRAQPVAIAMLHPGWVRTDMGGPGGTLDTEASVTALRRVIDGLSEDEKGVFLNHKGEALPW